MLCGVLVRVCLILRWDGINKLVMLALGLCYDVMR